MRVFQELGSKYIKFELPVRLLSRDVKWKVECLEGKREAGNINIGVSINNWFSLP